LFLYVLYRDNAVLNGKQMGAKNYTFIMMLKIKNQTIKIGSLFGKVEHALQDSLITYLSTTYIIKKYPVFAPPIHYNITVSCMNSGKGVKLRYAFNR